MAKRRMFSNEIVDTDSFLSLPFPAQSLYFHFGMQADDDGFLASPLKIMRAVGVSKQAFNQLIDSGYILPFESGVVVIRDWKINNWIQSDRYHATIHEKERKMVKLDKSNRYMYTECIQDHAIGKARLGKARQGKARLGNYNAQSQPDYKAEFDAIWSDYPKKRDKQKALAAYIKARKGGETVETIRDGVRRYAEYVQREKIEDQYIKHGSTFFNGACWNDDYTKVNKSDKRTAAFNNEHKRDYNMDELEKQLLGF